MRLMEPVFKGSGTASQPPDLAWPCALHEELVDALPHAAKGRTIEPVFGVEPQMNPSLVPHLDPRVNVAEQVGGLADHDVLRLV